MRSRCCMPCERGRSVVYSRVWPSVRRAPLCYGLSPIAAVSCWPLPLLSSCRLASVDGQVTFRPVLEDDLSWLASLTNDPAAIGPYEWHGWGDPQRLRRSWAESGLLSDDGGVLIVLHGTDRVGVVDWHKVSDWAGCQQLGHRYRTGAGVPGLRLRFGGAAAAGPLLVRPHAGQPRRGHHGDHQCG